MINQLTTSVPEEDLHTKISSDYVRILSWVETIKIVSYQTMSKIRERVSLLGSDQCGSTRYNKKEYHGIRNGYNIKHY